MKTLIFKEQLTESKETVHLAVSLDEYFVVNTNTSTKTLRELMEALVDTSVCDKAMRDEHDPAEHEGRSIAPHILAPKEFQIVFERSAISEELSEFGDVRICSEEDQKFLSVETYLAFYPDEEKEICEQFGIDPSERLGEKEPQDS